ncbi:MAG: 5-formyltetrahydrofolate cyclo-ligase [Desulfuromonadales bacterium]|nr:5-formyltetrahydrofolate cyclo-ligase [Desulfuromonadales bacterium]
MPKRSIRSRFLAERRSRPLETCISASVEIQQRFLRSDLFQRVSCLALYSAIHNEVLTETVSIRAIESGKTLVYPRIKDDELVFVEVRSSDDLAPGAFGVLEPRGDNAIPAENLDLVIVPGVAFDLTGHRLGYGRGFYDRALAECRADCVKLGFAYDSQLLAALPATKHDQMLSVLITESRTLNFTA